MSAHDRGSGPRSNAYSVSKFTNWAEYDPFFMEARAALKRFQRRIPLTCALPEVIRLSPLPGFIHACTTNQVEARLARMPAPQLQDLRAVFLLAGTRKQERCWRSQLACYGVYSHGCVFLCAHPFDIGSHNLDSLRDFYLDDVLVHEVAHHVDRRRLADYKAKEAYAHAFVQRMR